VTALEILDPGPVALLEDLGRPGLAHMGVTHAGAADRGAHALANRLVGNPVGHATIEVTLGGLSARVHGAGVAMVVTGADARSSVDGRPFGGNAVVHVADGQVVTLQMPRTGLRSYLAVRGGFAVEPVLGSRSHDVLSAIGPRPLRPGDVLPIGSSTAVLPAVDQAPVAPIPDGAVELAVVPGPRADWFVDPDRLVRTAWTATERSDRIGTRLTGDPLAWRSPGTQLPSEGAVRGSIQVPPNGLPVVLGPDHPVTGGYPVIGVVATRDLDRVAQVRPGQAVRFRWSRPRQ
jgi:biotin-dependent carboxylase-like uncharacterized protein